MISSANLTEVRRRGWAEATDEAIPGVASIAVSVCDPKSREAIGFCISYPAASGGGEEKSRIIALLTAGAHRIAERFNDPVLFPSASGGSPKPGCSMKQGHCAEGVDFADGPGSPGMKQLTLDDIEALAVGAWILGTGGGGSPYHALLNLRRLYAEGERVSLMDPDDLHDDDLVAVVSVMGAPLVILERTVDSRLIARAVTAMEEHLVRKFKAVMAVEIGGGNGMQSLLAAAHLKIPVVDADAMGRAYPEAQMTSFAVGDLAPFPLTSIDPRGNEVVIGRAASWKWMERVSRKVCTEFGSIAATCKAPRTGAEVKKWGIPRTTTKAINLGHAVTEARRRHADPIEAILKAELGVRLFTGKVTEVERRTTEGFLRGRTVIDGLGDDRGGRIEIDFQNEWVVVWRDGRPVVSTPDLICVLDTESGEAIGTETIRYGQRTTLIALPASEVFLSPRGLEHVGPRAFGYDIDFKSVFRS